MVKEYVSERGSSPIYPFDPSDDIVDGATYTIDLMSDDKYRRYVPFNLIRVTNNSGYRLDLHLDGEPVSAIFGRAFIQLVGHAFQRATLVNNSGSTIAKETIQVLVQKV